MTAIDHVRFLARCPVCRSPAVWTATKDPVVGSSRDTAGYQIDCARCVYEGWLP